LANLSFSDDCVDEIGVSVELVLNDVVEDLQKKEDQMVIGWRGKQKPEEKKDRIHILFFVDFLVCILK
jgi:hypothetical protein